MGTMATAIRHWFAEKLRRSEFDAFGAHEVDRLASEVGVSVDELYELGRRGPNAASRLPRRLQVLGFDPEKLATERQAEFRDMQRRCALCNSHGRCGRDLSRRPQNANWQSYCPNARTILAIQEAAERVSQ